MQVEHFEDQCGLSCTLVPAFLIQRGNDTGEGLILSSIGPISKTLLSFWSSCVLRRLRYKNDSRNTNLKLCAIYVGSAAGDVSLPLSKNVISLVLEDLETTDACN